MGGRTRFIASGLRSDHIERIERFFGAFLLQQLRDGANLEALLVQAPHLTIVTLVNRMSQVTALGAFVEEYAHCLGLDESEDVFSAISAAIPQVIDFIGIPRADDEPVEIVLAAQAGLIAREVPDVMELLDDTDGEATVQDLVVRAKELRADADDSVDSEETDSDDESDEQGTGDDARLSCAALVAQWELEALAEVLDSIRAFRAFTDENRSTWRVRTGAWPTPAMPEPLAEHVVAELRERPVGTEDRRHAVGVGTRELRPRILYNDQRRKVYVRLPEQKMIDDDGVETADIQWRVAIDGDTRVLRTGRAWGDPSPYSQTKDVSIVDPTREVTVADATNSLHWVVPVLDAHNPALIFTPRGAHVGEKVSLHYPELLIVCPEEAQLYDVVKGSDLPVIEEVQIANWDQWKCVRVDTSEAKSIQILCHQTHGNSVEKSAADAAHVWCVNPSQRVIFRDADEPIPCVRTITGLPVHAQSIVADFPPTVSGHDEEWYLSISAYAGINEAGMEITPAEPLEVPAEGGSFEIFDPELWESPWVGEYLIRLRGPRGESFRHECALVEGIRTAFDVDGGQLSFRIPSQGGLSRAQLSVSHSEKPFEVIPKKVRVDANDAGVDFAIATEEGDQLPLRFTPPRLMFELPIRTQPAAWRTTRAVVNPSDFALTRKLRLRVPHGDVVGSPTLSIRNQRGLPIVHVKMQQVDDVTFSAEASKLTGGTNNTVPVGRLELEWVDKAVDRKVSVGLADITSTPLAEKASLDDGEIVFEGMLDTHRLGVWAWPLTAPWHMGTIIESAGACTPLPEKLRDAGDLAVMLFSADPYNVQRPAMIPDSKAWRLTQPGYYKDSSPALRALASFLSGESEEAPADPEITPVLWEYLASARDSLPMRHAVQKALMAHPQAALQGLSSSLVPSYKQPGCILSSGLAASLFTDLGTAPELHRSAWLGSLQLLSMLPSVAGKLDSEDTYDEGRTELRSIAHQLEEIAGKRLVETITTGRDATLDSACIDRSTVQISAMSASQQEALLEMFFSGSNIVQGRLMEDSTRLLAVFETFTRRAEVRDVMAHYGLVKPAVALLRAIKNSNRKLYSAANVRFDKLDSVDTENPANLWALAPLVSMVLSLAARMQAHGMLVGAKLMDRTVTGWISLADLVPDLVTGDLIAAEAMVLAEKYPALTSI